MVATILLADDQDDLRMLLRTMLRRAPHGWRVVEASDGTQALARARADVIDAAVLDHRMPGVSGLDVARSLREGRFDGPIVVFSAYLEEVEETAQELGLVLLPKSEIDRLVRVVEASLERAS